LSYNNGRGEAVVGKLSRISPVDAFQLTPGGFLNMYSKWSVVGILCCVQMCYTFTI